MAGEILDNRGGGDAHWHWPQIHPEGRKIALIAAAASLVTAFLAWETIAWPLAFVSLLVAAAFRDPERVVPQIDAAILSPADGRVLSITTAVPPETLTGSEGTHEAGLSAAPVVRVAILVALIDVHVARAPIGGTVRRAVYMPGRFAGVEGESAAHENERQDLLIARADGIAIGLSAIAGQIARKLSPFVKPGDLVAAGQRIGVFFGGRMDVYLPAGTDAAVIKGQRVIAGETVLGRIGMQERIEGVNQ